MKNSLISNYIPKILFSCLLVFIFLFSFNQCNFFSGNNKVNQLKTLAKLHGLVRFFHPSHEGTEIDWNQHLLYSVDEVLNSKGNFKRTLEKIFLPVAPSMILFTSKSEIKPLPKIEKTEEKELFTWSHTNGVTLEKTKERSQSRRSGNVARNISSLYQMLPQKVKKGQHYVLKFKAKINAPDSTFLGKNLVIINDNKHEYLLEKHDWKQMELEGVFEKDADQTYVIFRLLPNKESQILLDDIELFLSENKENWAAVPIYNPSFEVLDTLPKGWEYHASNQAEFLVNKDTKLGRSAIELNQKKTDWRFNHKHYGEVLEQSINKNLNCWIPLALYGDKDSTYTVSYEKDFENLKNEIEKINIEELNEDAQNVKIANVILVWNVFQHFCPYLEDKEEWELVLENALKSVLEDRLSMVEIFDKMMYATGVSRNFIKNIKLDLETGYIPIAFTKMEDGKIYVAYSDNDEVKAGSELLHIDGQNASNIFEENYRKKVGTEEWKTAYASFQFSKGKRDEKAKFSFNENGKIIDLDLTYSIPTPFLLEEIRPSFEEKEKGVYYFNLARMTIGEFNHHLEELKKAKAIIFDMRGGVNIKAEKLFQHLSKNIVEYPIFRFTSVEYPNNDQDSIIQTQNPDPILAKAPYLSAKKIFLLDGQTRYFSEVLGRMIRKHEIGTLIGQKTSGKFGMRQESQLIGEYQLFWTNTKGYDYDNNEIVEGIEPDILVDNNLEKIKEGEDEILNAALDFIHGKSILSSKDLTQ